MSVGTAGYYTPPVDISGGTSQMSYAGGQNYAGESGEWGASGAYCADSYSAYMSAQYGALGESIAAQQVGVYNPSAYANMGVSGADPASDTLAFPGSASKPLNFSVINWGAEMAAVASCSQPRSLMTKRSRYLIAVGPAKQ